MTRILPRFLKTPVAVLIAGVVFVSGSGEIQAASPTGITLSGTGVPEKSPIHTLVGLLTAQDTDVGDTHTFTLIAGVGADDNARFYLDENEVYLASAVDHDFESGPKTYSIRVQAKDSAKNKVEKVLLIAVTDDVQEDADMDGLTEIQEEGTYGTSDTDHDFDNDGVGDGSEVAAGTSHTDGNVWPQTTLVGWGKGNHGELATPLVGDLLALNTSQNLSLAMNSSGGVAAFGCFNEYGQLTPPGGLTGILAVAAGGDDWQDDSGFSLVLKDDGTVAAWGYDVHGQIELPSGLGPVLAIDAGRTHAIALKADGTVATWGYNPFGGITPPQGLVDVVAVSAGGFQSLALKGDGTVVAWGSTFDGTKWTPATVPVGLADVVGISAGHFHNLALKRDGTVVAWGNNQNGQTNVPPGLSGVVALAAGGFHSLALKNDGTVVAWGLNDKGQLNPPPAAQSGVGLISAGMQHSLAVRRAAGSPAITSSPLISAAPGVLLEHQVVVTNPGAAVPVFSAVGLPPGLGIDPASGLISGTVATAARRSVRIQARLGPRTLTQLAWIGVSTGAAPTSVLLTPPAVKENSPAETVIGTLSALDPDAGDTHTFEWVDGTGSADNAKFRIEGDQLILNEAVTRDFEQSSAGFSIRVRARDASLNPFEQVIALQYLDDLAEDADGDGLSEEQEAAILTSDTKKDTDGDGFGDKFEADRATSPTAPAQFPSGRMVVGWGNNGYGQSVPPLAVGDFIDVSAGERHSLALRSNGTVVTWGSNDVGQTAVPENLQDVIAVEAGAVHNLALKKDGTVIAWGNNQVGQTSIPEGLVGVVAISAGGYHNLALRSDGSVVAWGRNDEGQSTVPAGLTGVVAVAAGGYHSLALKNDGTVVAWGWVGAIEVPPGLGGVVAIAGGGFHSLALKYDGTLVAWGSAADGQTAVPAALVNVTAIDAGWKHSLALKSDGTLVSWGGTGYGQTTVPGEAIQIRKIVAGDFHNLAIRQNSGFPAFADVSPIRSWPGEAVSKSVLVQNAVPGNTSGQPYSAMGLPSGLSLDPATGLISGNVVTGQKRAVRIAVETNQGSMQRVFWFDTADGVAPTSISLSNTVLSESSPAGLVVGTLAVSDSNVGDSHVFELPFAAQAPYNYRFAISGNQLVLGLPLNVDFEAGISQVVVRIAAIDAGNNRFEKDFTLQLIDDRNEDADSDGLSEAIEEDLFGTSDSTYDNLGTADADKDGVPGVIEYASNLNPKVAGPPIRLIPGAGSTAGLPAIGLITDGQGQKRLRLEYLRKIGDDLTYTPQFASALGLGDWVNAGPPTVTPVNAQWERCVVEDSVAMAQAPRRFGRVAVRYSPVINREVDVDGDGIKLAMEEDVFGSSDQVPNDYRTLDLDGDGTPGMMEYAFNLDPKVAGPPVKLMPGGGSVAGLPVVTLVSDGVGGFRLRLEYLRRVGSILSYAPQFTGDLASGVWQSGGVPVVTTVGTGWERCVVEDSVSTPAGASRFARVAVSW